MGQVRVDRVIPPEAGGSSDPEIPRLGRTGIWPARGQRREESAQTRVEGPEANAQEDGLAPLSRARIAHFRSA